ncbi:hypothetical protein [Saccharopolyspora spinosa]|uniref:hypothetical protein n=1 Tax=Saccharopolyspora spinosa TaxID=60894 RepID=UPI00376ED82E
MEALAEQGPLTVEQEAELAELQPKAQQLKKHKESVAKYNRAVKDAADRVVELEELAEQGSLTVEQEVELADLQPKAQQLKKKKDADAARSRAGKVAAARVVELEALKEQGPLTGSRRRSWRSSGRRRSSGRKGRKRTRRITGRERLLLIGLRCWRR